MFEAGVDETTSVASGAGALTTEQLASMLSALQHLDTDAPTVDAAGADAGRVEQIRLLEELKSAAAAVQAKVTTRFASSQEAAQREGGVKPAAVGVGVAAQVGLAKRESPARARRYLGWAQILTTELPHTFAALRRGEVTEWRAMIVARETGWLSAQDRATVDAQLAGRLSEMGDRRVEAETKKLAYRADPHGYAARTRGAQADRRVSLRPAPETMARLTGFLPVAQGVAAYAALTQHADTLVSRGDPRSRGQIMADTLVQRITGQATADAVPAQINLVMTDRTLFNLHRQGQSDDGNRSSSGDGSDSVSRHDGGGAGGAGAGAAEPAHLDGYGPIPAELARRLVADAPEGTAMWLRRLYTRPYTGALVAMDSRARCFDDGIRRFLVLRDQVCRTPWCDAPIRHADHPVPAGDRGRTSADNGQGLCEACNYAKQAPGWLARPGPGGAGLTVDTTTPTGHTYTSRPPDPPGSHHSGSHQPSSHQSGRHPPGPPSHRRPAALDLSSTADIPSRVERLFRDHVLAA